MRTSSRSVISQNIHQQQLYLSCFDLQNSKIKYLEKMISNPLGFGFVFKCGPFLKSLLSLLPYCFCFIFAFLATKHVESLLPDQAFSLHPKHQKVKP